MLVSNSRDSPCNGPRNHRAKGGDHHISGCTNGHASGQGCVLYMLHAELPLRVDECRHCEGRAAARTEGQVGVDHRPHLCISSSSGSTVETRPVHPEEDCADHGEEVTDPGGASLATLSDGLVIQHPGDGQPKICSEKMDKDCVSGIHSFQIRTAYHLIHVEENNLNDGHDDELDWAGGAQDNPESDEDCGRGKVCIQQSGDVDVDPGPVRGTVGIIKSLRGRPLLMTSVFF